MMMLVWFAETTLVATVLAALALLASRWLGLRPVARHALWLVVLVKLVAPPIVSWPWASPLVWPSPKAAPEGTGPSLSSGEVHAPALPKSGADAPAWPAVRYAPSSRVRFPDLVLIGRGLLGVWGVATAALALRQIVRVVRFRRRFRWAVPAPGWLAAEAQQIGQRMGVRAPEILVFPGPTTPMLWFLGRPTLLVPERLVETLAIVAWRGILAHELAHLLRRDHWVRRLELAAGLLWWWSPLYWLTRRRIDAEAELACDEWAVRAVPDGRLAYAEALLEICRTWSTAEPRVPALGVAGAGPFLERRVTMILREQEPSRGSTWVLMGAGLLALLALPGWNAPASSADDREPKKYVVVPDDREPKKYVVVPDDREPKKYVVVPDDREPKEKLPTDGSKKERPTKGRRIQELQSLIERLNKELESLKNESRNREDR
jgi:beta-lactamase regulating signal transducer with metallopeptidase domain